MAARQQHNSIGRWVTIVLILAVGSVASGAGGSAPTQPPAKSPAKSATKPQPAQSLQQKRATAKSAMFAAERKVQAMRATMQRDFENSSEYQSAMRDLRLAQTARDQAQAAVIAHLRESSAYLTARAEARHWADEVHDLRFEKGGSEAEVLYAAGVTMEANAIVSDMEQSAQKRDGRMLAAQSAVIRAGMQLNNLREAFEYSIKNNADFQTAMKQVADTRKAYAQAEDEAEKAVRVASAR